MGHSYMVARGQGGQLKGLNYTGHNGIGHTCICHNYIAARGQGGQLEALTT